MSTARDLITSSLRLIGAAASGESLSASEATDGLASLNSLIDSWSNEQLLIPNKVREVFSVTNGTQTYTMGVSGTFSTSRPMKIEEAYIQLPASSPVAELPVHILTKEEYARIIQKTSTSSLPLYLYSDGAYPQTNVSIWPVPNQTLSLVLYSWKPLSQLADLSTALSLPPGYERALRYSLAIDLAPEYGRPVDAVVAGIAAGSKADIKRMNSRPQYLRVDDALSPGAMRFDFITGWTR